jgi:hypothetical protein
MKRAQRPGGPKLGHESRPFPRRNKPPIHDSLPVANESYRDGNDQGYAPVLQLPASIPPERAAALVEAIVSVLARQIAEELGAPIERDPGQRETNG